MPGDPRESSFLAPPGEVLDWRMVVAFAAAEEAGLVAALPGSAAELARRLDLDARSVRVILDALTAWGIVERDGDDGYRRGAAAPEADTAATLRHHARALQGWTRLGEALRDPAQSRPRGPGMPPDAFQAALAVGARRRAPALADACLSRLDGVRDMLDLGGGHGEYALEFARRGVRATVQDRPEVVEAARRWGAVEAGGVELFAGDFFEVLPEQTYDLVLCAGVTHTMDGQRNRLLFHRAHGLVRPGGAFAVVTMLRGQGSVAALFAVQMLVNGSGGDTHAEADYRLWLAEAGFRDVELARVEPTEQALIIARR